MSEFKNTKEEVLLTANSIVNGDRNVQYGEPNADFLRTATMWNMLIKERMIQLGYSIVNSENIISPEDVGIMMVMLKCSRHMHSPKMDNFIDIAGYAACAAECREVDFPRPTKETVMSLCYKDESGTYVHSIPQDLTKGFCSKCGKFVTL